MDKSLYHLFIKKNYKCQITDICLIGIQILERLEWIHSKDIVYRDVKPENFLIGINDPNVIYVVDFGLCKKFRSSKTGKHLLPRLTGKFNGTLKYASPNVIRGKEASRRDDLISLGYILIYFYKRKLPWDFNFKTISKAQYLEIMLIKETNGFGKLFEGIPKEFEEFIKYSRNLKFEQDPDYSYLRSLLSKVIFNNEKVTFSWISSQKRENLLGIPRNRLKKTVSPQIRLLKSLEEERKKDLKRGCTSEVNLNKKLAYFYPKNESEFSSIEKFETIFCSETNFNDNLSDLNNNLPTKDSEKDEKIQKIKNIPTNYFDNEYKPKINDKNNNDNIRKNSNSLMCKLKMNDSDNNNIKYYSNNISLKSTPKKKNKTRNGNNNIKIKSSIPCTINNSYINNTENNNLKDVKNQIKNLSKEKYINYNDFNKPTGIINQNNKYKKKNSYRKKNLESSILNNITQNEEDEEKVKLMLLSNISYKTPILIKKIKLAQNNNNSNYTYNNICHKTSNNSFGTSNNSYKKSNNRTNLYTNNPNIKNKIGYPIKKRSKNIIRIIINNNIETKEKHQNSILHSNTNINIPNSFISNYFKHNFYSKNQNKY